MKACILKSPAPVTTNPLVFTDVPVPQPQKGEVLVRVKACGVCRTDLHVIEGELPPRKSPVIPGHQIVGTIEKLGEGSHRFPLGARVGIPWLHSADQTCEFCRAGMENLCDHPTFTGYTVDGGYAEYVVAPEDFDIPSRKVSRTSKPRRCSAPASSGFAACAFPASRPADVSPFTASARPPAWPYKWRATGAWKCIRPRAAKNISSSRSSWARSGQVNRTRRLP